MATQKQIKEWIPAVTEIFQFFMPCPELPEIHVVSDKTLFKKRAEIVERLQSKQKNATPDNYDSIMEMIHGDRGDAILIQQKCVPSPEKNFRAEEAFAHFLWHELGHYLAITSETTNLHRYADQEYFADSSNIIEHAKQEGYWFWSEFIAEAIANHVSMKFRQTKENYHPEQITWEPEEWGGIVDRLLNLLDDTFVYYPATIDEYSLAHYFSHLLKEDLVILYRKAATDGKLRVDNWPLSHSKPMTPGSIEPTRIDSLPETYQETLWAMMEKLERQMEKKEFWIISEDWLEEIGQMIVDLQNKKIALMASYYKKEATVAMNPPLEIMQEDLRKRMGDEQFEAMMEYAKQNGFV